MLRVDIEKMPSFNIGLERGMKESIEKGISKGKAEAKLLIAKSMLDKGLAIDLIVFVTGLSKEEVKKLK